MRKTITVFFAMMLFLSSVWAQSKGGKTVYSQLGTTDAGNSVQSYEQNGMWPAKTWAADDFTVGAEGMEILGATFITSFDSQSGDIEKIEINFFGNDNGVPGEIIKTYSFTSFSTTVLEGFGKFQNDFTFSEKLSLTQGTYWVNISGIGENAYGGWFLLDKEELIGNACMQKRFLDWFGNPNPDAIWEEDPYSPAQNLAFALIGAPEPNDLAVSLLSSPVSGELTNAEVIKVKIENTGLNAQSAFSVSYQVSATIDGSLTLVGNSTEQIETLDFASGSAMEYAFSKSVDMSAINSYNIAAWVNLDTDTYADNNKVTSVVRNYGRIYTMGEAKKYTLTNCDGVFVDNGGVNGAYTIASADTITFYPSSDAYRVAMTFDVFNISEYDFESWTFYDGENTDAPVIEEWGKSGYGWTYEIEGKTVIARNAKGILTLVVKAKDYLSGAEGWIASMSCNTPNSIEFSMLGMSLGTPYQMFEQNVATPVSAIIVNKGVDTVARKVSLKENDVLIAELTSKKLAPGEIDTVIFSEYKPSLIAEDVKVSAIIEDDAQATNEDNTMEIAIDVYKKGSLLESFENHKWPLGWYSLKGTSYVFGEKNGSYYGPAHGTDVMMIANSDTVVMPLVKIDVENPDILKYAIRIGNTWDAEVSCKLLASKSLNGPWEVVQDTNYESDNWHYEEINIEKYKGEAVYFAVTHNHPYNAAPFDFVRGATLYRHSNDLYAQKFELTKKYVKSGNYNEFILTTYNMGTENVKGSDYTIQVKSADSLYFTFKGVDIEAGAKVITNNVGYFATVDTIELRAEIICNNDMESYNNLSPAATMMVNSDYITSNGEWKNSSGYDLIKLANNSSISELILYPNEVGAYGNIKSLSFEYNYTGDVVDALNFQIFMAHTSDTVLAKYTDPNYPTVKWIGTKDIAFDTVFNGTIKIDKCDSWSSYKTMTVTFDKAFAYNGTQNLVILFVKNDVAKTRSMSFKAVTSKHHRYATGYSTNPILPESIKALQSSSVTDYQMPLLSFATENKGAPVFKSTPELEVDEFSDYLYNVEVDYTAALNPFSFELVNAPEWMTLTKTAEKTAALKGKAEAGTYPVRINVGDGMFAATQVFEVKVNAKPVFTSEPVLNTLVNEEYSYKVTIDYSLNETVAFAMEGADWMTFSVKGDNTASISGTPTVAGDYNVTIYATGEAVTTQEFVVSVGAVPHFVSVENQYFNENESISIDLTTTYLGVNALTIKGESIAELTLTDNEDGTANLAGTAVAGEYAISLVVTDGMYSDTLTFDLVVGAIPVFTSTPVVDAEQFKAYVYNVTVDYNGSDALAIESVKMPAWLTLTDNGDGTATLSGTPEVVAIDSVVIKAVGKYNTASHRFAIDVKVGLDDNQLIEAMVYPNPAKGQLYFVQSTAVETEISLVDLSGKRVVVMNSFDTKTIISLDGLNAGVYMLMAKNVNGVFNKQIVVK